MKKSIEEYVKTQYTMSYDCVVKGGKLIGDWQNVANHCFTQAVAAEALADLLGLPGYLKTTLARVAACHDWAKRLEKRPHDFSYQERETAMVLFSGLNIDFGLMGALTPSFLPKVLQGKATFLELIQFLLDDMTMGDKIVSLDERIDEVSSRNPNPEPKVQEELGRPYWEVEREIGHEVEFMVYTILKARHVPYTNITQLINDKLNERFPE